MHVYVVIKLIQICVYITVFFNYSLLLYTTSTIAVILFEQVYQKLMLYIPLSKVHRFALGLLYNRSILYIIVAAEEMFYSSVSLNLFHCVLYYSICFLN